MGEYKHVVLKNVEKFYGEQHVLKNINISVDKGETVSLIGPSGAGKSTLCRTINRLETISSGEIWVNGRLIPEEGRALAAFRATTGMVFQSFNLFKNLTVMENITIGLRKVLRCSKHDAREKAVSELTRLGVEDQINKYPSQLSGGQKQRVAIARALAMDPEVLLFDEPTSALDPEMVQEVLDAIGMLATTGITMIIVTHEMSFAKKVSDRTFFLADGEVVESGPSDQLFDHPKQERTRLFLEKVL